MTKPTIWIADEFGTLRFKCEGWELIRWSFDTNQITVLCDDRNLDIDVYEDRIVAKGESGRGWETSAEPVSIPFAVLRAILEVVDKGAE